MKKHILVLVAGMLSFVSLIAQTPAWERLNAFPQSLQMIDITRIPGTTRLIAAGMGSTIMISDDIGVTWQFIHYPAGMPGSFIAHRFTFINANTGFLTGQSNTILKTSDAGVTWKLVYSDSSSYFMNEVEFINDSIGFGISNGGDLLKTVDTGETWTMINQSYQIGNLSEIEYINQLVGYISIESNNEILKTIDGGNTWSLIPLPDGLPGYVHITGIKFVDEAIGFLATYSYDGNESIYKSTDSGLSWYQVPGDISDCVGREFSFSDQNHGIFTCSNEQGDIRLLITSDGGETWEIVEQAVTAGVCAIDLCYYNQNILFSTGFNGCMFKSVDGGYTWEQFNQNNLDGYIEEAVVFDQYNGVLLTRKYYDHSNVLRTNNGFESFENLLTIPWVETFMAFPDESHGFCFSYIYPKLISYRTNDGGNQWNIDTISDSFEFMGIHQTDFWDSQKGIILGENSYIITTDGGDSWEKKVINENDTYYTVDWISGNTIIINGTTQDTSVLFISPDSGISWETIEIPANDNVRFINENIAFLLFHNEIFKSTDGGNTWNECIVNTNSFNNYREISFPTPDTGYIAGWASYDNILKTVDAGETWNTINAPVTSAFNHVAFIDSETGYIFNLNDIFKTTTGGIVGINSQDKSDITDKFLIYPNPFRDEIRIDLQNSNSHGPIELSIINTDGKQVYNTSIVAQSNAIIFQGSILKPGVYVFKFLQNGTTLETKKMIRL